MLWDISLTGYTLCKKENVYTAKGINLEYMMLYRNWKKIMFTTQNWILAALLQELICLQINKWNCSVIEIKCSSVGQEKIKLNYRPDGV